MPDVPKSMEPGLPFAGGILSKIREILTYLERTRLIPGDGIRFTEMSRGIEVSIDSVQRSASGIRVRKKEVAFPEYSGPWGLSLQGNKITTRGGLIWEPGVCRFLYAVACDIPDETSLILVDANGVLSAVSESFLERNDWSVSDPLFWNAHVILGKYDAETESVSQYHFSPIVYMIQTEEFVIEP